MWKDKVVIITGSSMGIGKRIAEELGKSGASIVINSRDSKSLNETLKGFKAKAYNVIAVKADISDFGECKRIIDETINTFGKIDVLFNNAGITGLGTVEEMKAEAFKMIVDVNFLGSFYMTNAAIPHIKKTKGSIMFTGSLAGIQGIGNHSAYSSSKMALTGLAESLKIELHGSGVHTGIAYVSFTENDPKKKFLSKDGTFIYEPDRTRVKAQSTERVANQLIKMVENRKYRSYFTVLGKLNIFLYRLFPYIIYRLFLNVYKKDYT